MSQVKQIKKHLMEGKGLTSLGALKLYNSLNLKARIHELRDEGLPIKTTMITVNGKRIAKYTLERN